MITALQKTISILQESKTNSAALENGKKVLTMPKPTIPVIVTDPDGQERRFPSVTAAAKYIGVIPPRVSTACTLGIRLHGYRVRYENGVGQ